MNFIRRYARNAVLRLSFQKFSRGSMPPDPPRTLEARCARTIQGRIQKISKEGGGAFSLKIMMVMHIVVTNIEKVNL